MMACGPTVVPSAQSSPPATASSTSTPTGWPSPSATTTPGSSCGSGAPAPTLQASPAATGSPSISSGAVAGTIGFPFGAAAPQLVYAISTSGPSHAAYSTETVAGQSSYSIKGVAPGEYHVFAAVRPLVCKEGGTVVGAPYSDFWKCGATPACGTHGPAQVIVKVSATTDRVDPADWFTSDKTVPAPPPEIVSKPPPQSAGKIYASAREAAAATARAHAAALMVDSMANCPVNRACISIGNQHDGTQSAYFNGEGGSNADVLACMTYVVHDPAGWRGVRSQCPAVFPAVGQSGMVWLGGVTAGSCGANVRSSPGPTGKVVACLQHHTGVSIDGGPVYAPMSSMDGIWWHLAGQGWMADDLLIFPEICGCD